MIYFQQNVELGWTGSTWFCKIPKNCFFLMRLYWLLVTHRKSGLVALTHENHKRKALKGNIYGQNCCLVFHISGKICWIHISCPGVSMSLLSIRFNIPDHQHHYWEMAGCLLPICIPGSQNRISSSFLLMFLEGI